MSSDDHFLSRWSRRKAQARAGQPVAEKPAAPSQPAPAQPAAAASAPVAEPAPPKPLPPVESLTPESDFAPFMDRRIDPSLRRTALKTLFQDPRFNVMDGLDVYIDDYSKPDPIPPEWLDQLSQSARLGDYQPKAIPEEPAEEPRETAPAEEKAPGEQSLAQAPAEPPIDTSDAPKPAPKGRESTGE